MYVAYCMHIQYIYCMIFQNLKKQNHLLVPNDFNEWYSCVFFVREKKKTKYILSIYSNNEHLYNIIYKSRYKQHVYNIIRKKRYTLCIFQ